MLLSFAYLVVFAVSHGLNEYYDLTSNISVGLLLAVPCLFVTALSWLWPHRGSAASLVLASVLLVLSVVSIMTAKVPPPGQELPVLTFAEIATYIVPYVILLCGSILVYISTRKDTFPDLLPEVSTGNARVDKLRKAGLLMILISSVVGIVVFITLIGISGDSMPAANIFSGLVMGLTFAMIPLILGAIAWQWPDKGGIVAVGLSLAWLIIVTVTMVNSLQLLWIVGRIVYPPIVLLLIGSSLVFFSTKGITGKLST